MYVFYAFFWEKKDKTCEQQALINFTFTALQMISQYSWTTMEYFKGLENKVIIRIDLLCDD